MAATGGCPSATDGRGAAIHVSWCRLTCPPRNVDHTAHRSRIQRRQRRQRILPVEIVTFAASNGAIAVECLAGILEPERGTPARAAEGVRQHPPGMTQRSEERRVG